MQNVKRARALVMRYGWNATTYQIVNPGIQHWFSRHGDAVVGYVLKSGVCVVAGAPVCHEARLRGVVTEWEGWAARHGWQVCYFGAAGRVYDLLYRKRNYATVVLGAQPVWNPAGWPEIMASHKSLRAQFNRARNKGVQVVEWSPEKAMSHPQLKKCLRDDLSFRLSPVRARRMLPFRMGCRVRLSRFYRCL